MTDVAHTLHDWRAEIASQLESAESERPALLTAVSEAEQAAAAAMHWAGLKSRIEGVVKTGIMPGALAARLADAERQHKAVLGALAAAKGKLAALAYRVDDLHQAIAQLDRALAPAPISVIALPPLRPIHAVAAAPEIDETIRFPARSPA